MPVFEQGYRRYDGPKSDRPRALAIAWENVRPRVRPWTWGLLFVLLGWPYLVYAVLLFVATLGPSVLGVPPVTAASISPVAFDQPHGPDPRMVLGLLQGSRLPLFFELLDHASTASVIFPAILGAGLLADDRRTGALQIYFARPVTRGDYLLGKVLAVAGFTAFTTLLPCLALWIESLLFSPGGALSWQTWVAPLAIAGASALYALWTAGLVLSLSAVLKRPVFVRIFAVFLQLLLEGLGHAFARAFHEPAWNVLRPSCAVGSLAAPLLGMDLPVWLNGYAAFGIGFCLPVGLLAFVWWRVRAVEVVT